MFKFIAWNWLICLVSELMNFSVLTFVQTLVKTPIMIKAVVLYTGMRKLGFVWNCLLCEIVSVNPDCFDVVQFGNDCHGDTSNIDCLGNTLDNDCLCNPTDCLGNPLENVLEYNGLGNPMEIIVVVSPWKNGSLGDPFDTEWCSNFRPSLFLVSSQYLSTTTCHNMCGVKNAGRGSLSVIYNVVALVCNYVIWSVVSGRLGIICYKTIYIPKTFRWCKRD